MHTRAEQPSGPLVLEVERFEHVPTGAERVLLRVDGRYGNRPGKRVLDARLFVDDGLAVHRHSPVDDGGPKGEAWLWRAAFDVPAHYLTDERTRFALESEPGCLIDLPRPADIARGSAVPITARAAHLARRYAVAVAVLVAVAVTPGGLPASARTEILRVHQPDGSVIYLTRDGQQIASLPADAVVIDQGPAPQPEPAPEPAPEPQPEPQPEPKPAPKMENHGATAGLIDGARENRGAPAGGHTGSDRKAQPRKTDRGDRASDTGGDGSPAAGVPAAAAPVASAPERSRKRHHRNGGRHDAPVEIDTSTPPSVSDEPLASMPQLLAAPGSDDAKLHPLSRVGQDGRGAGGGRPDVPTQDFVDLPDLSGGTGAVTTGGPLMEVPDENAPPLIPISPGDSPVSTDGDAQEPERGAHTEQRDSDKDRGKKRDRKSRDHDGGTRPDQQPSAPIRNPDGTPTRSNPTYFDALPGPARPGAVPDFVIEKFRIPPFLLPIYQAAGIQYGIRWEVLAAINEIETDYGRNLNVSSAGALGWMQFMPATWKMYGTDANRDGKRDPYNPVDAIFAAARYLKAAGAEQDIRRAIFAYNHADWYVDSVMLRAKLIAGYPADLVGSLTGLTEGRFPVAARARYANDVQERAIAQGSDDSENRGIDIFAREGAPVVATNDAIVKKIGHSKKKGHFIVLQDVYGNQYTYSNLGSVSRLYPVPKDDAKREDQGTLKVHGAKDPKPSEAASAGSQAVDEPVAPRRERRRAPVHRKDGAAPGPITTVKRRLFANPSRPNAQRNGGFEQVLDQQANGGFETYDDYFARPLGLNSRNATLRRLKKGSKVVGGTVLGRVGAGKKETAPHLHFEIRPAGRGAPKIDPKPILDGWKLLESTAIYRASGKNALYGDGDVSIGEMMLLPKPLLQKRILSDPRIEIYPGGEVDIETGQIDRRVLVALAYLAESGLHPTVSSLKGNHGYFTASGNVSAHSSGNAVDVAAINGVPIAGHQGAGDVTEQAVRRLMLLQGTLKPDQIISLLDFGDNTLALSDHDDHIHIGFQPLFGANRAAGRQAQSVLEPGQWDDLVQRLGEIENPTVPTKPSRYALPTHDHEED